MPENGLTSALELIQHIKASKHGGYFCVGAACYPEGHPNKMTTITAEELPSLTATELARHSKFVEVDDKSNVTYKVCKDAEFTAELEYLKQKVDAGASFLVTQMFFDVNVFDTFVKACRAYGITVPIIPGIMLIGSYGGFKRMIKMCKTRVPESIERSVDALQSNDEGIKEYGIKLGVEMASLLLELGSPGLHFYTLNSAFQTSKILDELASLLPVLNVVA